MVASTLQERLDAERHVKSQHFFIHPPDGAGAMVITPVSRIQNHRAKIGKIRTPLIKERATRQKERQCHEKEERSSGEREKWCRQTSHLNLGI